jgi:hypothetical protein
VRRVQLDVPREDLRHGGDGLLVVQQVQEGVVHADAVALLVGAGLVQPLRGETALVDAVDGVGDAREEVGGEGVADDEVAVLLEELGLLGGKWLELRLRSLRLSRVTA